GATYEDNWLYPADQARFGTEKCDVTAGPHSAVGDFTQYDVHIEPLNGIGASLHFEAVVKPYRQGTAVIALGDNDEFYYTDLSVPNNRVSGTITVNGAPREVTGFGYHDHQWMNIHQMQAWHHWLWGHLSTPDYTVLLYDFVASEQFGFTRVPLFGVMEHTTGDVIFSTDGHFTLDTTLERQEEIGKDFPKVSDYTFTNADGTSVELHI
ncbi:MAG: hypothetical protein KDB60_20060, partial [Propionibacteriaceae bacterium]|nr:hypothetical protein [Propionibacteriaceae bacterium]